MATRFAPKPDAVQTVMQLGQPGLEPAARAVAAAIPGFVPVVHGTMRASYKPSLEATPTSQRVHVGSPFYHWMEYGTRYNAAYRPVQTAVRSLGLRFEPS
jgi:hypothetical protein